MSFINTTTYRLVSNNNVVSRIWDTYQRINPLRQELEMKDLIRVLDPTGRAERCGRCGLILSAEYSHDEKTDIFAMELKVEGKGFPAPSIFHWLTVVMGGSMKVNYRTEAPEIQLFQIHNEFGGFDEKYYVQGEGLFEALEGAYISLDEFFRSWSEETGVSLDGKTEADKIDFINTFTDYDSDDDFLRIYPYVRE